MTILIVGFIIVGIFLLCFMIYHKEETNNLRSKLNRVNGDLQSLRLTNDNNRMARKNYLVQFEIEKRKNISLMKRVSELIEVRDDLLNEQNKEVEKQFIKIRGAIFNIDEIESIEIKTTHKDSTVLKIFLKNKTQKEFYYYDYTVKLEKEVLEQLLKIERKI